MICHGSAIVQFSIFLVDVDSLPRIGYFTAIVQFLGGCGQFGYFTAPGHGGVYSSPKFTVHGQMLEDGSFVAQNVLSILFVTDPGECIAECIT